MKGYGYGERVLTHLKRQGERKTFNKVSRAPGNNLHHTQGTPIRQTRVKVRAKVAQLYLLIVVLPYYTKQFAKHTIIQLQ